MELTKQIIIFIDNYKTSNCSHIKGYLNYKLLKSKYKNVIILWCNNNITITDNKILIYKYKDNKKMNKKTMIHLIYVLKIILFYL